MQKITMTAEWEIMKELLLSSHPAVQLVHRFAAAILGGYGLTYSLVKAISLWLPLQFTEVVFFSALLLPIVYLAAIIWAFAAKSVQIAWKVLLVGILVCGALALLAVCLR